MNRSSLSHILIVEDEKHLAEGIRENLQAEGYETTVAHDGVEAFERAMAEHFDLILLDVMMPRMDGLKTCEELRRNNIQTPVLFLTVKSDPEDRIRGLEAGGDDYLAKPFHLKELLLRVAAILKRTDWYNHTKMNLSFGGNKVDFKSYHANAWDGTEHLLTHKEAMILKILTDQVGMIVPREDILDKVWGYEVFPSTRTIDNFIVRLRKRFERNAELPEHFHTVRGVGYRFTEEAEATQRE